MVNWEQVINEMELPELPPIRAERELGSPIRVRIKRYENGQFVDRGETAEVRWPKLPRRLDNDML